MPIGFSISQGLLVTIIWQHLITVCITFTHFTLLHRESRRRPHAFKMSSETADGDVFSNSSTNQLAVKLLQEILFRLKKLEKKDEAVTKSILSQIPLNNPMSCAIDHNQAGSCSELNVKTWTPDFDWKTHDCTCPPLLGPNGIALRDSASEEVRKLIEN